MPGTPQVEPALVAPIIVVAPGMRADAVRWGEHHGGVLAPRRTGVRRWPPMEPERPLALHDSWWIISAAGVLAASALAVVVWIAVHLTVDPVLHKAGLFVHLASLVIGFGGVLMADYLVLRWLAGRSSFAEALHGTNRLHAPIWIGLVGLVASGAVLEPNLASILTRTKLALVLILTINGLQALILSRRLAHHTSAPLGARLLVWAAGTGLVSQFSWWGAIFIGFLNAES